MQDDPIPEDAQPMTQAQADQLRGLCERAAEPFDSRLTRAEAQAQIDRLTEDVRLRENL